MIAQKDGRFSSSSLLQRFEESTKSCAKIRDHYKSNPDELMLALGIQFAAFEIAFGLTETDQLSIVGIRKFVLDNYGDITVKEIGIAVDMALSGQFDINKDIFLKKTYKLNSVLISTVLNAYKKAKVSLLKKINDNMKKSEEKIVVHHPNTDFYNQAMRESSEEKISKILFLYKKYCEEEFHPEAKEDSLGDQLKKSGGGFASGTYLRGIYYDILQDVGLIRLNHKQHDKHKEIDEFRSRLLKSSVVSKLKEFKNKEVVAVFEKWRKEKKEPKDIKHEYFSNCSFIDPWKIEELVGFNAVLTSTGKEGEFIVKVIKNSISKTSTVSGLPYPIGLEKVEYDHNRGTMCCTFNGKKYDNISPLHFVRKYNTSLLKVAMFSLTKSQ